MYRIKKTRGSTVAKAINVSPQLPTIRPPLQPQTNTIRKHTAVKLTNINSNGNVKSNQTHNAVGVMKGGNAEQQKQFAELPFPDLMQEQAVGLQAKMSKSTTKEDTKVTTTAHQAAQLKSSRAIPHRTLRPGSKNISKLQNVHSDNHAIKSTNANQPVPATQIHPIQTKQEMRPQIQQQSTRVKEVQKKNIILEGEKKLENHGPSTQKLQISNKKREPQNQLNLSQNALIQNNNIKTELQLNKQETIKKHSIPSETLPQNQIQIPNAQPSRSIPLPIPPHADNIRVVMHHSVQKKKAEPQADQLIRGLLHTNNPLAHFEFSDLIMDLQISKIIKTSFSALPNGRAIEAKKQELHRINDSYLAAKEAGARLAQGLNHFRIELFNQIGELIMESQSNNPNPNFRLVQATMGTQIPDVSLTTGIPRGKIQTHLPTGKPHISSEPLQCSICLQAIQKQDKSYTLVCGHSFHSSCCEDWVERIGNCPMCRKNLKF